MKCLTDATPSLCLVDKLTRAPCVMVLDDAIFERSHIVKVGISFGLPLS